MYRVSPGALALSFFLVAGTSVIPSAAAARRAAAPKPAPRAVALLPFSVSDVQLHDAQRLNEVVAERVRASGWLELQEQDLTNSVVDASKTLGVDCSDLSPACASEVGRISNAELVVTGQAQRVGNEIGVRLRLVSADKGEIVRQVYGLVSSEPALLADDMGLLASTLVEETPSPLATLSVQVVQPDAVVYVDGIVHARGPQTEPITGLAPGSHEVRIEAPGYVPSESRFGLARGKPHSAVMPLREIPVVVETVQDPTLAVFPWVVAAAGAGIFVGGAGAVIAGGIPAASLTAANSRLDGDFNNAASYDATTAVTASSLHDQAVGAATSWNSWGRIAVAAGAAAIVVGTAALAGGAAWGVATTQPDAE